MKTVSQLDRMIHCLSVLLFLTHSIKGLPCNEACNGFLVLHFENDTLIRNTKKDCKC